MTFSRNKRSSVAFVPPTKGNPSPTRVGDAGPVGGARRPLLALDDPLVAVVSEPPATLDAEDEEG